MPSTHHLDVPRWQPLTVQRVLSCPPHCGCVGSFRSPNCVSLLSLRKLLCWARVSAYSQSAAHEATRITVFWCSSGSNPLTRSTKWYTRNSAKIFVLIKCFLSVIGHMDLSIHSLFLAKVLVGRHPTPVGSCVGGLNLEDHSFRSLPTVSGCRCLVSSITVCWQRCPCCVISRKTDKYANTAGMMALLGLGARRDFPRDTRPGHGREAPVFFFNNQHAGRVGRSTVLPSTYSRSLRGSTRFPARRGAKRSW